MTAGDLVDTAVGPAAVLHRLLLGVVLRDGLTSRGALGPGLRVGREAHPRLLPHPHPRDWPCLDLERMDGGRYRIRHGRTVPGQVLLRLDDRSRRYVPRRLAIPLWPLADLVDPDPAHFVPVASRTLNAWLSPGSAYPLPRGATAIRGRVVHDRTPVRWVRVTATDTDGALLARAHGDDRGEFLLVLPTVNDNPVTSEVAVDLLVEGPADPSPPAGIDDDPLSDLPVEAVPRASVPPTAADLGGPLVRGSLTPAGYVPHTLGAARLTVPVGDELVPDAPLVFDP